MLVFQMDFSAIIPKTKGCSYRSEIGLFSEVVTLQQSDPSITKRLLLHPLAEGYLQLKWSQV